MENEQNTKPCLFCNIVDGRIKSNKVYEDDGNMAFLDIHPRSKGMTIVIPRKHYRDINDDEMGSINVFAAAQILSKKIKQALGAKTVQLSIINSPEVPHFHIRLYPIYSDEKPLMENAPIEMAPNELENIATKIKMVQSAQTQTQQPAPKQEPEKELSSDEIKIIKRRLGEA